MDFSTELDALQKHAADAKAAAQAAATETRDQLKQRIGQAQGDLSAAAKDAKKQAAEAGAAASSKWQQMKADAAGRMDDIKAKIDKRSDQIDAGMLFRWEGHPGIYYDHVLAVSNGDHVLADIPCAP